MATDTAHLFPASAIAVLIHRGCIQVEFMDFVEIDLIIELLNGLKTKNGRCLITHPVVTSVMIGKRRLQAILKVAELYPERWEEPPEKLADIIKPRDPTLTRDGTNKLDALWGKWKAVLDKGPLEVDCLLTTSLYHEGAFLMMTQKWVQLGRK